LTRGWPSLRDARFGAKLGDGCRTGARTIRTGRGQEVGVIVIAFARNRGRLAERKIGEVLIEQGTISREQLEEALEVQKTNEKYVGAGIGSFREDPFPPIYSRATPFLLPGGHVRRGVNPPRRHLTRTRVNKPRSRLAWEDHPTCGTLTLKARSQKGAKDETKDLAHLRCRLVGVVRRR
jgi:hypothetical protein